MQYNNYVCLNCSKLQCSQIYLSSPTSLALVYHSEANRVYARADVCVCVCVCVCVTNNRSSTISC